MVHNRPIMDASASLDTENSPDAGKIPAGLYIVATPIGNLGDISPRAASILRECDLIACEDSRVTGKLLHHLKIATKMTRYNDHSRPQDRAVLIERMRTHAVALVSDAGTPLISDPGYKLVREARAAGIAVTSMPGPSAVIAALTLSGLPTDRFMFMGFLPHKASGRAKELESVKALAATLVFYESGPRLAASLAQMAAILGRRDAAVSREISKKFEETATGPLDELAARYKNAPPKGEIVITIGPPEVSDVAADPDIIRAALTEAMTRLPVSKAAGEIAKAFGADRKALYTQALSLKNDG